MKKVSVIIACRNEVNSIEACIQSALTNETESLKVDIIVCDGKSDDGTYELLARLSATEPRLKVLVNKELYAPHAFNLGIKNADGDYVLIVGARHILAPDYLTVCLKAFEKDSSIACVGGKVNNVYVNRTGEIIAQAMDTSFGVGGGNFRILREDTYTDTVGTPLYHKAIFEEIGLFDENLVRNQDDEFNFRLTQSGRKILFTPKAELQYYVRGNYLNLFKQYFQYGYWKVFVNKKHKTVTTVRQLFPMLWMLFLFLGWLPALLIPEMIYVYLGFIGLYFLAAFYFSAKKSRNISTYFSVIWVFLILHCSYGLGYLNGIWHFLVLKKQPTHRATSMSR